MSEGVGTMEDTLAPGLMGSEWKGWMDQRAAADFESMVMAQGRRW